MAEGISPESTSEKPGKESRCHHHYNRDWSGTALGPLGVPVPDLVCDREDVHGKAVPGGVYFARLESASGRATVKVVLE